MVPLKYVQSNVCQSRPNQAIKSKRVKPKQTTKALFYTCLSSLLYYLLIQHTLKLVLFYVLGNPAIVLEELGLQCTAEVELLGVADRVSLEYHLMISDFNLFYLFLSF